MTEKTTDIVIIGGGMVGAACAVGLAKQGFKLHLIEQSHLPIIDKTQPYDLRISAISKASVELLQSLGAWQFIEETRVCPYRHLETWEIEGFSTKFSAQDLNLNELGYMIENNIVQVGLWQCLTELNNAITHTNCSITKQFYQDKLWHIQLATGEQIVTPLIIAADGANSKWRDLAGIGLHSWQYRQSCMLITVDTSLPQQDITWQQFYPSGPRAFLPLQGQQACLVWYDSPEKISALQTLTAKQLTLEIEQAFPARLGKVSVQAFASFPLTRRHALNYVQNGVLLIGDAAHTINPLAGQGVNLGFKDVKALLKIFANQPMEKWQNPTALYTLLQKYERSRKADNLLMQTSMDIFYKAFKENILPLKIARNLGLIGANKITPLKKRALRYALGL